MSYSGDGKFIAAVSEDPVLAIVRIKILHLFVVFKAVIQRILYYIRTHIQYFDYFQITSSLFGFSV